MTGGNETLVIKDYVNGTFGITLENAAPVASNDTGSTVKNIKTVIDVLANDRLVAALRSAPAAAVASEEMEGPLLLDAKAPLLVAIDPLDGSSNADANASIGTIFTVPTAVAAAATTLAWLREQKFAMWAARVGSGPIYTEVDYSGPTAIVLGSEAEGLSARWWADDIRPIHLPMLGRADSLNVSVAAAIVFYEALRQRSPGQDGPAI